MMALALGSPSRTLFEIWFPFLYNQSMDRIVESPQLVEICKQNNIEYLGLFGSYARGENTVNSDIDLLVKFSETKSLFELSGIERRLEQILGNKVDLVIKDNIKPRIQPYIYQDLKPIYEKG